MNVEYIKLFCIGFLLGITIVLVPLYIKVLIRLRKDYKEAEVFYKNEINNRPSKGNKS